MRTDYDVIVIGGGPAGERCAGALADGGARVAIAERELVAGECSYWACIPSKTLLRPGEALANARGAPGAAEAVDGDVREQPTFAWRDFMVSGYDDAGQVAWLESKGIDLHRGSGRIAGHGTVAVGDATYTTTHIVLATGSDPVIPPVPGLREADGIWTNREATGLTEVPRRLLVLGGGPVGVEMAQAIVRMGAEVALVEGMDHVLPREPKPLGDALGEALAADGIELRFGMHASAVRRRDGDFVLEFGDGTELRGDRLLVATGRRPRVEGLGLEAVGIDPNPRGIPVDGRMAAGQGLWAIGDATGTWPLTYVGKYQGRVGEATGARSATIPMSAVPRTATYTRAYDERPGFLTLVSDGERLTGAYALGPEAGEWLQQATLAIRARIPLEILRDTIQPFPTFSEAILFALLELTAPLPAAAA